MMASNILFVQLGVAIWALWGVSWLVASLWRAREVAQAPRRSYRWLLGAAFAGYFCLFAEPAARLRPLWLVPPWAGWLLVTLVAVGMAFAWWARLHLGRLWSGTLVLREGHRVVDSGPYALVRHPIYTGIIVGAVALALIKATPLALLGACLIAFGFAAKARVEERFLAASLGEATYADYARRVPMLVPFAAR